MNTVNVLVIVGIVFIGFLIRREIKHGEDLEKQSQDDKKEASRSLA
jgi:hypothetical protein